MIIFDWNCCSLSCGTSAYVKTFAFALWASAKQVGETGRLRNFPPCVCFLTHKDIIPIKAIYSMKI